MGEKWSVPQCENDAERQGCYKKIRTAGDNKQTERKDQRWVMGWVICCEETCRPVQNTSH